MKLGFLTACMPERSLEEIATWAAENAYEALELAAWPQLGDRPFTASHVAADRLDSAEVERVRGALDGNGLRALGAGVLRQQPPSGFVRARGDPYPRSRLHRRRGRARRGLRSGRSSAGIPRGASPRTCARPSASSRRWSTTPASAGVRLMIENCVMEGWHPDGYPGNLAYSPELWEWMFELGLYLNFDPSHLLWLGIDPVDALRPYVDRVVHAHAKDAETFPAERNRYGFFGRTSTREQDPWDMGWWRYRIPGLGDVDFRRYVDTLYEGGFDGVLSVEHEDPVWGGSPERVEAGLEIAHRNLRAVGGVSPEAAQAGDAPLLQMRGIAQGVLRRAGAGRRRPRLRRGRGPRDRRRERSREVDADEDPRRRLRARARARSGSPASPFASPSPPGPARGGLDHLPGVQSSARPHRRREHLPRPGAAARAYSSTAARWRSARRRSCDQLAPDDPISPREMVGRLPSIASRP